MKNMIFMLLLMLFGSICIFAEYSTLNLGIGAEPFLFSPAIYISDVLWGVTAEIDYSLRTMAGESGYFATLVNAKAGTVAGDPLFFHDKELFSMELGLDTGDGRLIAATGLLSSMNGTLVDLSFYIPSWELKYYFQTERELPNVFISYVGNVKILPDEEEDLLFTGTEAGVEYWPTATSMYSVKIGAWWENWYEYTLYNFGGGPSGDLRNDFVSLLSLKAGGIYEFYLQWEMEVSAQLRISNANRYIPSLLFYEEASENNLMLSCKWTLDFTWNKFVNLKIIPGIGYQQYFARQALGDSGALLDENAYLVLAEGLFHFDWTFDDMLYYIIELSGRRDFSNDSEMDTWNYQAFLGVKIVF
ncbi:MAG: hypothetical protein EHM28_09245 [Spirochaetaceae bacterium]|nr:MAG: hypothetical protein EHM28_09245 [Spirochaetaceae bacterium]